MSQKTLILALLAIAAFADGAIGQFIAPGQLYPKSVIAFMLIDTALIFIWYRIDSTQRGYRRTPWLNIGVIGLSIIALPYYFFRSRGARGGFVALGLFFACVVLFGAIGTAGEYAIYYGLQS